MFISSLILFALLLFFSLAETGNRANHGNFLWQIFVVSNILFLMIMTQILEKEKYIKNKLVFILFIYGFHIISGTIYLSRLFLTGTFH